MHVTPKPEDLRSCMQMAELLRIVGYRSIGLTLPTGLLWDQLKAVTGCFRQIGLEAYSRVDLVCSNRQELLKLLRRFRNLYDIVSVKCTNQNVAMVACRDRRVDVVIFDPNSRTTKFTHTLANLLHGAVEFNHSFLLNEERQDTMNRMMKQASVAAAHRVQVALSSSCSSPAMVRSPLQLMAVGMTLGLRDDQAHAGVSSVPLSIIESNRERRTPPYVEEGVRIVMAKDGSR